MEQRATAQYPKNYKNKFGTSSEDTTWNYVPASWAEFFPQKTIWAFNASTGQNMQIEPQEPTWLSFEAFNVPKVDYTARLFGKGDTLYKFNTKSAKGKYRFLYPNTQITEAISHTYNEDSSTFASALAKIGDKVTSVVNAPKQAFSGSTEGAVYDGPVIWAGMERRRFTISLRLFAFTDLEQDIYAPIRFFRENSLPSRAKGDTSKRLNGVTYPSVFRISGGAFDTLSARADLNFYQLLNVNVEFNDSSKLLIGGIPINARIDLVFQEAIKVYRDLLDTRVIEVSINKTDAKNGKEPIAGDYTPRSETFTAQSTMDKIKAYAINYAKTSAVYRLAENIKQRAINEAIGFVMRTIMGSSLYKRLDDIANLDPVHRLELYRLMKKSGIQRSGLEPAHIAEISNSNKKPSTFRNEAVVEQSHKTEIQILLTKVR